VLRRAGHTEAAVDLVRLAGVGQVAAIAELVQDDGSMMRWEQAAELARAQGLVLLTIEELIGWRRAHDVEGGASGPSPARVERVATAQLPTRWGSFEIVGYRDRATGAEHVALVHPGPGGVTSRDPLVRVHSECLTGDALGSLRCDCGAQLAAALQAVASEGGAVVYMGGHEGRGIGLVAKVAAYALQDSGLDTVDANVALGSPVDGREYGAAAAILADVGWDRVRLLTNNPAKVSGLTEWGVAVSERVGLDVGGSVESAAYRRSKRERLGHALSVQ
jgi:3,4-dihydroxy 2-butanone 4-phosphate synthase/GTP cyclohydrolase II